MGRKEIKGPITDNTLNSTNHNFKELYDDFGNVVKKVSDKAFDKVVDSAKLNWKEPVSSQSNLPSGADEGDTRMAKDTGKVYRFNGSAWVEIQQIDAGPVNEVDTRLTSQLAETDEQRRYDSMVNRKEPDGLYCSWVDDDGFTEVYDRFKQSLIDYNIPITSALITKRFNTTSKYLNQSQVRELRDLGMEFISHTHNHDPNHRPTDMTEEELDEDFRTTQSIMKSLGCNYRGIVLQDRKSV